MILKYLRYYTVYLYELTCREICIIHEEFDNSRINIAPVLKK